MTNYYDKMNAEFAFKDHKINNLLGEVIAKNNLKQLRISETEKYAHVTFFFNGQIEKPFKNETRIIVKSPKVATYDLKPEMSIYEVTKKLVNEINKNKHDFIVVNLVNADMVGHSGIVSAIKKAITAIDDCLIKIVKAGLSKDYDLIVFADHGNAEDQTPRWRTSHTLNPVPCILISNKTELQNIKLKQGGLQDIAPTVLDLMNIKSSVPMSGKSLIEK
jgi:2,3-bisphosphoglycerate-independent phosphoglycerate mutase